VTVAEPSDIRPSERERLDRRFRAGPSPLNEETRRRIWSSVDRILAHGPMATDTDTGVTGLALGYVQSGKTTSIISLLAAAADVGYRIGIALLGSTNLLLDQNVARLETALGLTERVDYRWILMKNPSGKRTGDQLAHWLERSRVVLIPVLKHAGRIDALAEVLRHAGASEFPALIIDDEADQASLNTRVNQQEQSRVYAAIGRLRVAIPRHLYVQYTATPYAPLLLEPSDHLAPEFVEMLEPGEGYTGGKEFFVDQAATVVRPIPTIDEQAPKGLPTELPSSLIDALGNFLAGAGILLAVDSDNAPVSMLVHSTYKNDVQDRYVFLIQRALRRWKEQLADPAAALPPQVEMEAKRLFANGASHLDDATFAKQLRYVLSEASVWLINSASDIRNINWNVTPVHILVGGNKLDRGYTVEGLTVSYMNRPASPQVDTLEQRARAFGYRGDLIPYCQFFAPPRTIDVLRGIVYTEYDMRAELGDWVAAGNSLADWAARIGLLLPAGTKPTRDAVVSALTRFNQLGEGWHSFRMPSLTQVDIAANDEIVRASGILTAPYQPFRRLQHRSTVMTVAAVLDQVLSRWNGVPVYSPGWHHEQIIEFLHRVRDQTAPVNVVYMASETGGPRTRRWDPELGFVNLFQGADLDYPGNPDSYPGDRHLFNNGDEPSGLELQFHYVRPRDMDVPALHTLAVNLGKNIIVRRADSRGE
jgi:hypothetical protein